MKCQLKPQIDLVLDRFEAFWDNKIIDRPMYSIVLWKDPSKRIPLAYPDYHGNWEERWLDIEFRVKEAYINLQNQEFYGDAIPFVCPGMGTDILAASTNCGYKFDGITGWSTHDLDDWTKEKQYYFDTTNKYYQAQMTFVKRLIEEGKGKFIVGHPDYHPTGDQLASTRGTQNALMDLVLYPEQVKGFLARTQQDFYHIYDTVETWLQEADMPSMSWTNIAAKRSHWMICNDFSIMISPEMFKEFFLPYVQEEAKRFHRSMYHLDGAGAIHHLDALLAIEELNGIQFLPGAGAGEIRDYIDVFVKIQESGKCLEILNPTTDDLPIIFQRLRPEGVILNWIQGAKNEEEVQKIEQQIMQWGKQYGY